VGRLHWARVRHKGGRGEGGMQRRTTGGGGIRFGVGALARPRMGGATSECEFGVMV